MQSPSLPPMPREGQRIQGLGRGEQWAAAAAQGPAGVLSGDPWLCQGDLDAGSPAPGQVVLNFHSLYGRYRRR
ncbi:hypothetical protein CLOM_g4141 [Closterium sp. NIES-68]|nr:hypothetical protein CLOM_g4141 [Closterium sp. NIES-68]